MLYAVIGAQDAITSVLLTLNVSVIGHSEISSTGNDVARNVRGREAEGVDSGDAGGRRRLVNNWSLRLCLLFTCIFSIMH